MATGASAFRRFEAERALAEDDDLDLRRLAADDGRRLEERLVAPFVLERQDRADEEIVRPEAELTADEVVGRPGE